MTAFRILVVDDHPVARRSICSLLAEEPGLDVICETADGEDAVLKAKELRPDLILLDISLPGISGIEAAQQIREVSPESRIIFVSQHDSVRIAKEALSTGAHGYVVKSDAGRELLKSIRLVREGKRFLSHTLITQGWTDEAETSR